MSLTIIDVMRPEVEDYLDYLRTGKNISDSTAVSYRRSLGAFYDYALGPEGPGSLEDVVPETLQAYENRLRLGQYASVSLAGAMGTVCGFLRWLYEEDRITADPAAAYQRPKASPAPVRVLTLEELSRLFAAPGRFRTCGSARWICRFPVSSARQRKENVWVPLGKGPEKPC